MKMYENPEVEVTHFEVEDILTTSPDTGDGGLEIL